MTVLQRTDLTTSQKIQCAAAAVAGQHAHGSKTALSETYEISRPTVYAVGAAAESVLRSHFETPLLQGAAVDVRVDDAQLRRAVVALRVLAPNAIRPIEDLVPLLYPGVKVSYGTIQHMLVEAKGRAARLNAQASLDGVEAGALDEMFSQGEPVLAGVDLDGGYLFGLSLSATRDGDAWAQLLREGQCQGLELSVVVKDAAKGIAAGVSEVFPRAEQRDDCFHVLYEMNKVRRRLERRAYGAIEREGEALGRLGKIRVCDRARRRKAKRALSSARRECAEAIGRFDAFEAAMDTLRGALECVDIATGELHRPEHVQALIEGVAQRIESLAVGECAKLAKYLRNRAPGLVLAQKSVLPRLEALAEPWSAQAVSLACICWYLVRALHKRPARALRGTHVLFDGLQYTVKCLAERGHRTGAPRSERVLSLPSTPTILRRYRTSVRQTEQSGVRTIITKIAKGDIAALAAHRQALQPVSASVPRDDKQQGVPVTVSTRSFQGTHLSCAERRHIRTTFCPTNWAREYARAREE